MEGETKRKKPLALVLFFAVVTIGSLIGFALPWRRAVASEEGAGIDGTITYLLVATAIILIAGHAVLIWLIWKSGSVQKAATRHATRRAEWLWAVIPVLLMMAISEAGVLVVSGPVWDSLYAIEPKDPVELDIVGKQFEWYIRYPGKDGTFGTPDMKSIDEADNLMGLLDDDEAAQDDIVKRDQFKLPLGRPVVIRLRSYDVIHSFFVPEFRVKQDLIPGFGTRVKFTPTRAGTFELACAELCGMSHFKMRGQVEVVSQEEFDAWLAKQITFGG